MANNLLELELLINLSEKQQELVSGGACTETREPNYTLIECSDTTTETTTEEDETAPGFLSIPMLTTGMGPMTGFSLRGFPRMFF